MREGALAAVTAICISACGAVEPPHSADVYFRPFEATSIVRLDESIMVTSAGSEFHITSKPQLARILSLLDAPCQTSPHPAKDMDLRLLIYFNSNAGRTTWKASRFDYYNGFTGKVCATTPALMVALSKEFGDV